MKINLRGLLYISGILLACPTLSQNLLPNGTFTQDTDPWEVPGGLTLSHDVSDGFIAPGIAEIEGVLITLR